MKPRILVAYASISGSTGEVASAIADELAAADVRVDVMPVRQVEDIRVFDAVVLGSSIRVGHWLPEASNFLEEYAGELSQVPVAYFTTCLTLVENSEEAQRTVMAYMEGVLALAPEIQPVGLGLFAGSFDPQRQRIVPSVSSPHGDYRDWRKIRAWARDIRPDLLAGIARPSHPPILGEAIPHESDLDEPELAAHPPRAVSKHSRDSRHWSQIPAEELPGARLQRANMVGADLKHANLSGADLSYAILNGANLSQANLTGADLRYADLHWADMSAADLRGARLGDARLSWADLSSAALEGADLARARYNYHTIWPEGFSPEAAGCIYIRHLI